MGTLHKDPAQIKSVIKFIQMKLNAFDPLWGERLSKVPEPSKLSQVEKFITYTPQKVMAISRDGERSVTTAVTNI